MAITVCFKYTPFALNFIDAKEPFGSIKLCLSTDEYNMSFEFTNGVYLKQNYCYKCANDMLAIHYIGCIREWQ